MKHTIQLYLAPKIENAFLEYFEGDKTKVFCRVEEMTFTTASEATEKRFRETMERSKKAFLNREEDFWIAAIKYMDNFFKEDESSIIVA